jgi:glycosyltransferase involved in cell wall biosynthesis
VTLTVAVVIPTIPGREAMLDRALRSVREQTRHPDELIVAHDHEGKGAAVTRNTGLALVNSDLVAWLDDDDELLPNHVERLARVLERAATIDLVYPIPEIPVGRDPTAVAVNGIWQKPWGVPFGPEQETHLRTAGSFIPITHVVRTSKVREIGGFPMPGDVRWIEDWGYLVKLLDAGARFHHLPVKTWRWHIHDQHTGGDPNRAGPVWEKEHR